MHFAFCLDEIEFRRASSSPLPVAHPTHLAMARLRLKADHQSGVDTLKDNQSDRTEAMHNRETSSMSVCRAEGGTG